MRKLELPESLSRVNPSTYVQVYAEPGSGNEYFVPKEIMDRAFNEYGYRELLERFVGMSTPKQVASGLMTERSQSTIPQEWKAWCEAGNTPIEIKIEFLPGIKSEITIRFLGDCYGLWITGDESRMITALLKAHLEGSYGAEEWKFENSLIDYSCFFSLPNEHRRVDFNQLSTALHSAFGIDLSGVALAETIIKGFLYNEGGVVKIEDIENDAVSVQCWLTSKHLYNQKELDALDRPWDEVRLNGIRPSHEKIFSAIESREGSVVTFRRHCDTFPPEFQLRVFLLLSYALNAPRSGALAVHRWVNEEAIPRFALEITKLHIPEFFS